MDSIKKLNTFKVKLLIGAVIFIGIVFASLKLCLSLMHSYLSKISFKNTITEKQYIREIKPKKEDRSISFIGPYSNYSSHILTTISENEQNFEEMEVKIPELENSIISYKPPISPSQIQRKEIITYTVKKGDTLSDIALNFGINIYTLIWANKLSLNSVIRPGDELIILPVNGILHKIRSGETVSSIAKKYKADANEIISFNSLPLDGKIEIGQEIIVPGGIMPSKPKPKKTYATYYNSKNKFKGSHHFPYGQCTWYVAQKRKVPWGGHAKDWLKNAKIYGYSVCIGSYCKPKKGAIVVLRDGGWLARRYGHVAYIERVEKNRFLVSEMNRIGWGKVSVRWINYGSKNIRGMIY